jgi:hypothetical protein
MEQVKLSEELREEIVKYLEGVTPLKVDWSYDAELSKEQLEKILESDEGLAEVSNDMYEMNIDYIFEMEDSLIMSVIDWFSAELREEIGEDYDDDDLRYQLRDEFLYYLRVDINMDELIDKTGALTCLLYLHSNYDCTNSFDTMEDSEYLRQVYKRVKAGVKKDDFMWEHMNGAYGGSVFCFAFQCDINELVELKRQIKTGTKIVIPKGTQFGFFSSMVGSGSIFEKTTYKEFSLNIKEEGKGFYPEYDRVVLIADIEQSYNMHQVYGDSDFISEQTILIK